MVESTSQSEFLYGDELTSTLTELLERSRGEAQSWKEIVTEEEKEEAKQMNESYKKASRAIDRFPVNG